MDSLHHFKCKFDTSPDIHLYVPGTHRVWRVFLRVPRTGEGARIISEQTTTMEIFTCKRQWRNPMRRGHWPSLVFLKESKGDRTRTEVRGPVAGLLWLVTKQVSFGGSCALPMLRFSRWGQEGCPVVLTGFLWKEMIVTYGGKCFMNPYACILKKRTKRPWNQSALSQHIVTLWLSKSPRVFCTDLSWNRN